MITTSNTMSRYETGDYWQKRGDLLYYQYFQYFIRCLGPNASSLIDVGSGNAPYLEWFDWIPERASVDIRHPYSSDSVRGIKGNILDLNFGSKFDICSCMQVLEHVPEPHTFARRLLEIGDLLLVSVPYKWSKGSTKGHIHDPVDLNSLTNWFGRKPNYNLVVREPFKEKNGARLFAVYDSVDPHRVFNSKIRRQARPRK